MHSKIQITYINTVKINMVYIFQFCMEYSKKVATILSYLLSPVTVALYVIVLILVFSMRSTSIIDFICILMSSIIFLCILPIIGILIYAKKGKTDIWVSDRKTRTPFYALAIGGYIGATGFFYILNLYELFVLALTYVFVTSLIAIINLKSKISSHCAGITSPFTAMIFVFSVIAIPLFCLLPPIIWSRWYLKAHNHFQLLMGSSVGIIITASVYFIMY